jgi:hypothetical protein
VQWYEGEFYPCVGTSVLVDVNADLQEAKVISLSEKQFILHRKHLGSVVKLNKLIKVENSFHQTQETRIKTEMQFKSQSRQPSLLSDRKREKKKKWKQHSKISIQKIEGVANVPKTEKEDDSMSDFSPH